MPKISAVIITKNEERNIGRCLKSLEGVPDEIIVVDSFSTDKTREISESFDDVRFVEKEWLGYSDTKNFANSLASHPFVLTIDADEELTDELRAEIQALKPNLSEDVAYSLNRLTNYCGKWIRHSGWHPDHQLRLYPKARARWNKRLVHESVELDKNVYVEKLAGILNHFSYYSVSEHLERAESYTDLAARELAKKKKKLPLLLKTTVSPLSSFIQNYFLKLGVLDGYYGLIVCGIGAYVVFLKYSKALRMKAGQAINPI